MDRDEFERAADRLRQLPSNELAAFIIGLLVEHTTGIGDYARAFAAPDCATAARLIEESIGCWRHRHKHDTYHQADLAAQHLEWTLDAIERCVLPHDPQAALRLIVRFFEGDADLGQDDLDAISEAFRRAAGLFRKSAASCPPAQVQAALGRLMASDDSGYRIWLADENSG